MTDELNNNDNEPVMVLVQDEDGVFLYAIPYPETPMNGEGGTVVAAVEPLEVVETVPVDAANLTPEPGTRTGGEVEAIVVPAEVLEHVNAKVAASYGLEPDTTPTPPANMMSVAELADYDSETVRLVSSKESYVCQLEANLVSIKSEVKDAKKSVEEAKEELRELIQNRDRQRGRKPAPTLFTFSAQSATVDEGNATDQVNDQGGENATTSEPVAVDPLAELWREYPMTVTNWKPFGLTAKDIERLNSGETKDFGTHPIRVLGDITRFITPNEQSPGFTRSLMDFKGFGEKSYDRWLSAESAFWDWWNNKGGKQAFADEQAGKVNAA